MDIIVNSEFTESQMAQYLINKNPNAKSWALEYAQLYLEEGETEGVRGDGAWIQSCKETGNFKFDGGTAVTFDQNNFCGLGVTKKGMKGHSFDTPRLGIRAQIQHLKGYATTTPLVNPCIDPRYGYINPKGKAPRFEDLAGKWAVPGYDTRKACSLQDAMNKGIGYGFDIISGIEQMKKIVTSNNIGSNIQKVIGIDRGHGLHTGGKRTPDGIKEWTLNDVVADKVVELLANYDVKIIHTDNNEGNVDESLSSRRAMYVNQKVDAFVSIHHNANTGTWNSATGVEIYTDNNPTQQDISLANAIYKNLPNYTGLKGRGIKKANFAVINQNSIPAVLVEGGFMDGTNDYKVITSKEGQLGYAKAIAEGLIAFLGLVKKTDAVVSTPTHIPTIPALTPTPNSTTNSKNTYTVVSGDTLSKIGVKTGVAWKTIAELNGIKPPYTIKVGQVLKLTNATNSNTNTTSGVRYLYNGVDYSLVFNPTYYSSKYPDLKNAYGTNAAKLFEHFTKYGMSEGRMACTNFNVNIYKNRYVDLQKAFGNDLKAYYKHYSEYGYKEGRSAV